EAVRTTRGDCGSAVPDGADPDGACAGAGDVCAESARSSVEVTVDQYALGTGSGLARPSQFVTGGGLVTGPRQRRRRAATTAPVTESCRRPRLRSGRAEVTCFAEQSVR